MTHKRKVLLINPRMCSLRSIRMPLSLLHLAAALEGLYDYELIDGNLLDNLTKPAGLQSNTASAAINALRNNDVAAVCVSVMPGPQVAPAIEVSAAVRAAAPNVPIIWGGYFPSMYADSAINAPYVDAIVRGQGEDTLRDLLQELENRATSRSPLRTVGVTWKDGGEIIHNPDRPFRSPNEYPALPYHRLDQADRYLRPSFLGSRTAVHQAAIGCRYRCAFCGVVTIFNGVTKLSAPARLHQSMQQLRNEYGATAIQFFDHNFFDQEESSVALLEAMADEAVAMPWWCYARADTLAQFAPSTWDLIAKSKLKMAYIGAEAASDSVLRTMHKGTTVAHTLEVAARCREYGVIPEFSFVLGGPQDPEGEIEKTFAFIKQLKRIHPGCEVILYFYSPTPQRDPKFMRANQTGTRLPILESYGPDGPPLPTTPEEWTQSQWIAYVCHQDAPWLTAQLRQRIKDFVTVLGCRFPTVQDVRTPRWGKAILETAASWRWATDSYNMPAELRWLRQVIPLREPEKESL